MRRRSRSSLGSWWKPTATPVARCPTLDNASPAGDLVGEQAASSRTSQSTARIDRTARKALCMRLLADDTVAGYRLSTDGRRLEVRNTARIARNGVRTGLPRRIAGNLPLLPSLGSAPCLPRKALDG